MMESAAIGNIAQNESFEELGVEEYEIVETLDGLTCDFCGDMDSRHYPMEQFEIGVTAHPFIPDAAAARAPIWAKSSGRRYAPRGIRRPARRSRYGI